LLSVTYSQSRDERRGAVSGDGVFDAVMFFHIGLAIIEPPPEIWRIKTALGAAIHLPVRRVGEFGRAGKGRAAEAEEFFVFVAGHRGSLDRLVKPMLMVLEMVKAMKADMRFKMRVKMLLEVRMHDGMDYNWGRMKNATAMMNGRHNHVMKGRPGAHKKDGTGGDKHISGLKF
jgi:hypothetical protein